jgi:low temperature requirement protein LtrA
LSPGLLVVAAAGLVLMFGLWWGYFKRDAAPRLRDRSLKATMIWAYSHFGVFGAVAAVGAGLGVVVDTVTHHNHLPEWGAALTIAIPTAIYLILIAVHRRLIDEEEPFRLKYVFAGSLLLLPTALMPLPAALVAMAVITSALVGYGIIADERAS